MTTESVPRAADADHLTQALRRSGSLDSGRVSNVTITTSFKKLRSHTLRLRLDYDGARALAPASLILKLGHLDAAGRSSYANAREIAFYREVASAVSTGLTPRCFEVVSATETSAWHLLLEDLTDSHVIATAWPLPPTRSQCESIMWAQASFHAAWWDHPLLSTAAGGWLDQSAFDRTLQRFAEQFARFIDQYGEMVPSERRDIYQRLLDQAPHLLARYHSHLNLTVIHGDAHPWNFFLPRNGGVNSVRLIDWEAWSIDTATDDLAYMMAMLWYPDRRRQMERILLDLYHGALIEKGVSTYSRQALYDDYRLSVLWLITRPVVQAMANIGPAVWWNNLERIMLAVDDLGCRELLT